MKKQSNRYKKGSEEIIKIIMSKWEWTTKTIKSQEQ